MREFVGGFAGLSGQIRARQVAAAVPEVRRLSDFEERRARIPALLYAMRAAAWPPKPEAQGVIGEANLFARMAEFRAPQAGRRWYRKSAGGAGSVAFVVEVGVAEVADRRSARLRFRSHLPDPRVAVLCHVASGLLNSTGC